jgi:cell division protein FtsZ
VTLLRASSAFSKPVAITVIATGFENAELVRSNVTPLGSLRRSNLAVPTYIRNEKPVDAALPGKAGPAEAEENPDLEIPTFLRRQAD